MVLVLADPGHAGADGDVGVLAGTAPSPSVGLGLVVGIDLGPEAEAELRASAKRRGVTLRQEVIERLRLSLQDVSSDALSYRVAGGEEDE